MRKIRGDKHPGRIRFRKPPSFGGVGGGFPQEAHCGQKTTIFTNYHLLPMSKQAIALVEQCIATKSDYLDLGNCGLIDKDFEKGSPLYTLLLRCKTHLRSMVFSNEWYEYYNHAFYLGRKSNNSGEPNTLSAHPPALLELSALTDLNIGGDSSNPWGITNMEFVAALPNLKQLNISHNKITEIKGLDQLNQIQQLDISRNQITEIKGLDKLNQLQHLDISSNQIKEIKGLDKLNQLQILNISSNKIKEIKGLDNLNQLQILDIAYNQISDLSPLLALQPIIENKLLFRVVDNPLKTPPREIANQGIDAIKAWFAANKVQLNEIKVLLIGDAKAGKTSLCTKLKNGNFKPEQEQTDGIFINTFDFRNLDTFKNQAALHDIRAYFWDFGGQEIMSATHQFFMTRRSVYILLLEARKDAGTDQEVRKWMERIRAFGGDSPVIIVGNKIELHRSFGIDTPALQRDYPQIKAYLNVSCATGEAIDQLKDLLAEWLPKAELFNTEIDERWLPLKNELQELTGKAFKLSHEQFTQLCIKHGVEDKSGMHQAIHFLNDLGIVLHFDELHLAEYFVLDPLWVTTGVYRILTSETVAKSKGKVLVEDLRNIVNTEAKERAKQKHMPVPPIEYGPGECSYLAEIMAQFKLAYFIDNKRYLLIPDLLDKETPMQAIAPFENNSEAISFIHDYNYLPAGILARLMATFKDEVTHSWHTGFILQCDDNLKAHALVMITGNRVRITVTGEHKQKREFLSIIRYRVDEVNKDFTLKIEYFIPLPNSNNGEVLYHDLLKLERRGRTIYEYLRTETEYLISHLLDGITRKEDLPQQMKDLAAQHPVPGIRKTRIFLASSSELTEDREAFEMGLARLNDRLIEDNNYLEVVKWEKSFLDAMDRKRLQDTYNRAIKECDVFVMLYHTKVGMYTAEEFETAFGHFSDNNRPLIYTYFKDESARPSKISEDDFISLKGFQRQLKALGHFETAYTTPESLLLHFRDRLDSIIRRT